MNSVTNLGLAPLTAKAGLTTFFLVTTYDLYGNLEKVSYNTTKIDILGTYVNHNTYLSPIGVPDLSNWDYVYGKDIKGLSIDNGDGTYSSQYTIYRAGTYALSIKVNYVDLQGSPYSQPSSDYLYITPSDIYAPNCVVKQVVLTYTAGVTSTFKI